jgi:hypothetical protein
MLWVFAGIFFQLIGGDMSFPSHVYFEGIVRMDEKALLSTAMSISPSFPKQKTLIVRTAIIMPWT